MKQNEHLLNSVNKCDRSVATMKEALIDLAFIIFGIFGSWWILLLIILSS